MSIFGVFLVRIFPHSDWIRRYASISPYSVWMRENTGEKKSSTGTSRRVRSAILQRSLDANFSCQCLLQIHLLVTIGWKKMSYYLKKKNKFLIFDHFTAVMRLLLFWRKCALFQNYFLHFCLLFLANFLNAWTMFWRPLRSLYNIC